MNYLDANVFIHAAIDDGPVGTAARQVIAEVHEGRISVLTSAITFDEVVWIVRKESDVERSIAAGRAFLGCKNLHLIPVDRSILAEALDIIKHDNLHPKDAIHYATMRSNGVKIIISNDSDFDKIKEIRRKSIEKALA